MRYITSDTKKGNTDSFIRLWHSISYFEMIRLGGDRNKIAKINDLMKGFPYKIDLYKFSF